MLENEHLRRQIVRQTVAENLALIEGTRSARHRGRRPWPRTWRWAFLILLPGIVGTSAFFSRPRADARLDATALPSGVEAAASRLPAPATQAYRSRWATDPNPLLQQAPERIDPSVFPLQVRHIVVDPGHGGEDIGTQNGSLSEKELTLDIALRLRGMLRARGFEVSMTRDVDRTVVLRERTEIANRLAADVFVSIHINWIATRQIRGIETYYLGPTEDPELAAVARRENRNSGYSLADQDSIIRSVILNAHHERSRQLADRVQHALFRSLRPVNRELRNRGVKSAPFVVLVGTEMPAILAEVSCLSNQKEAELLRRPLYREHIAEALSRGILGYAGDVSSSDGERQGP